ncbi:MAG: zf-HC2 domain-containing protein [Thermodesulfobacteriota bacterium]
MKCKELAYLLDDYLDGSMEPGMRREVAEHINQCEPCKAFTKTYRMTCRKAAELRGTIEYKIPCDVQERLTAFLVSAAKRYPEEMEEYRRQAERERKEKVLAFFKAAREGKLSPMCTLLVDTHVAVCPCCKEYMAVLMRSNDVCSLLPAEILEHAVRLLEALPPGEEFFLA